jgi:hypothetical protein
MRTSNFLWKQEPVYRGVVAAEADLVAARDDAATADDPTALDQSLPVPWEWWPSGQAAR